MGKAMMGTGEADGEERARLAAEAAISNPLLDDVSMKGARGVLINITGGPDMTLFEVDEAANRIGEEVDSEANIIFGSALDPSLEGRIRVSVVATGIDIDVNAQPRPVLKVYSSDAVQTGTHGGAPTPAEYRTGSRPQPVEVRAEAPAAEVPIRQPEAPPTAEPAAISKEPAPVDTAPPRPAVPNAPFIPPVAVEAPKPAAAVSRPSPPAEPPRGAAMPSPAQEKRRAPNLFQRMTGAGWNRNDAREPTVSAPSRPAASDPVAQAKPASAPPSLAAARHEEAQPTLQGVEPSNQAPATQSEEDLLDIPAFLRRQAN